MANKTIATANYGCSEQGLRTLKSNLQGDCSRMIAALSGKAYNNLIAQIEKYWAGIDAENWINDLKSQVSTLEKNIKGVSSTCQGYLDADISAVKSFQAKRASK